MARMESTYAKITHRIEENQSGPVLLMTFKKRNGKVVNLILGFDSDVDALAAAVDDWDKRMGRE